MRLNVRRAYLQSVLLAGAVLAGSAGAGNLGCSSVSSGPSAAPANEGVTSAADNSPDSGLGSAKVTVNWTAPAPGEQLAALTWTVTQPSDAGTVSGTVDASSGSPDSFVVGSLPPDPGHTTDTIGVSGTTTDGFTSCSGSSSFQINPNKQTNVPVTLQCNPVVPDSGYAQVNGTTVDCATLLSASASPSEVTVGHSLALTATAAFPNPTLATYAWSATSGTFSTPMAATTSLTCTAAGPVTVTIAVGDGTGPGDCVKAPKTRATFTVTCD